MMSRLPVILLLWPLLLALLALAVQRWPRAAAAVGVMGSLLIWSWLTAVSPVSGIVVPDSHSWTVAGTTLSLLPGGQALLRLLYLTLAAVFALALFWPQGVHFVPGALVALVPLALTQLAPSLLLGLVALCLGLALLSLVVQAGRPDATPAALRYLFMTLLALPPLLLAAWLLSFGQAAQAGLLSRLLLLGLLLLLAGFPFFVWVGRLVLDAPLGVTVLLLGVAQTAVMAFFFQILFANGWLLGEGAFVRLARWSGVATALVGGLLALTAVAPRRLLGSLLLLDMGFALLTLTFPTRFGWETALALLLVRLISLLLAVVGLQLLEDSSLLLAGCGRKRPFAALLLAYGCLSLLGLPLTVGFGGKWVIMGTAVAGGEGTAVGGLVALPWLTILLLLATAMGTYGLFRLLAHLFAPQPDAPTLPTEPLWQRSLLTVLLLAALLLAAFPQPLLRYAHTLAALFG